MDPNSLKISVPPDKPVFKICLDDIDFSLLHSYETTVPLYTLQSREYIDFEVYSQEIPRVSDDENFENEELRRCHICEVDVPASYWECHKASSKHRVYNEITQISLDRLRKQTELDLIPVRPSIPRASTYYCEICSQSVHCTQRDSHNESNEHVTNKNHDDMIKKLMLIYKNPNDFENIFEEANQAAIKQEIYYDPLIKTKKKLDWWDEVFLYPKKVNPSTSHKIHYIDNNTVAIITKSEAKLAVNFDNFHGYRKDKNKIVCQVCLVSTDDKYEHMNDDRHIRKMIADIKDKHCIRQLAPKFNHCILCNEITENREEHITTERHESFLKQATIDDEVYQDMKEDFEKYDTNINTQQNWWDKVFLYPKKVNPMTVHKIQYIDDNTIEVDVNSGAKLAVNFDNFHGFCEDAEKIICRVCRTLVDDKYTHMEDDGHIKKITAAIEDKHCIRRLDQIFNHCILCNEIIENSEMHISTERHEAAVIDCMIDDSNEVKKTLADNSMSVSSFDKQVYFCNACQIYVEQNSLTHHLNEQYHTEALEKSQWCIQSKSMKTKGIQSKKKIAAHEYCAICNVHVTGGKKVMKAHKKTDDHKYLQWLSKKDNKLHHHLMKIKLVDNVTCKVCKIIITADKMTKDEHIASISHQYEYKQLLQQNEMETLDHKYVSCHACRTRVLTFEDLNHIQKKTHKKCLEKKKVAAVFIQSRIDERVTSAKSQELIQKGFQMKGNDWYCIYCNVTMEEKYIDEHIKTEWHASSKTRHEQDGNKDKPKMSLPANSAAFKIHSNKVSQDDNGTGQLVAATTNSKEDNIINTRKALLKKLKEEVFDGDYCTVCKVPVKATEHSRLSHTIFSDHRYKFYLYSMEKNARWHYHMKETVGLDILTCKICQIQVKPDNESVQRHIDSDKHVAKFRSLTGNFIEKISELRVRCRLCNVSMLFLEEISHLSTKRHKKNCGEKGSVKRISATFNTENESLSSDNSETVEEIDEEKMRSNDLIKTGSEYYCNACRVIVEHNCVDIHIDSDMHRINITKNVPAKGNNIQDNIAVKPKRNKTLHYVYDFDYKFDVKCKICNVGVTFDRMVKHRQEESHKEKFRNVLETNTMFRIHYISFCECCMEIVALNLEYEHFTSEKHAKNLSNLKYRMARKKVLEIAESMFRKYDSDYCRKRKKRKFNPFSSPEGSGNIADESFNSSTSVGSEKDCPLPKEALVLNNSAEDFTDININLDTDKQECCENGTIADESFNSLTSVGSENDYTLPRETLVFNNSTIDFTDVNISLDADKLDCCESESSFASALTSITETNTSNVMGLAADKNVEPDDESLCVPPPYAHLFREENPKQLNCQVCKSSVSIRCDLIVEHVQGKKHCKKYLSFLAANYIKEYPNNVENLQKYHCSKCDIDFPDTDLFPHVSSKTHYIEINQRSASLPQAANPYEVTNFSFIPDISIYYWCNSYDNDPFYLLSTVSQKLKLAETLKSQSSNSTKQNIAQDTSIYYWRESYDKDPFYLLSTISQKSKLPITLDIQTTMTSDSTNHNFRDIPNDPFYLLSTISQKSKLEKTLISQSSESTRQNIALETPVYYSHEIYSNNSFYLLSTISQQSRLPSMLATPSQSNENVKQNCTPDRVNGANVGTSYLYDHYDPARSISTILPNSVLSPKMLDKQSNENLNLKTDVEHQATAFSKNIKDDWSDESTEPNSELVSQENKYLNILRDNTESSSDRSTKRNVQFKSQYTPPYYLYEHYDPLRMSVVPNALLSVKFKDKQSNESTKPNVQTVQQECRDIPPYYFYEHYDPLRMMTTVANALLSGKMVDKQSNESSKPNAQTEHQDNTFSKVLGNNRFEVSMTNAQPISQKDTFSTNILREHTESRSDKSTKESTHLENQGNTQRGHQKNSYSKVLEEKNTITAQSTPSTSQSRKLLEVSNKLNINDSFDSKRSVVDSFCHVCQVKLPDGASGITIHVTGARHRKNLENHIKATNAAPLKPPVPVLTNNVVNNFCSVCKVTVTAGGNNISEHVKGVRHIENLAIAEKRQKPSDPAALRPPVVGNFGPAPTNYVVNGFCSVCKVKVPTGSNNNIAEHIKGARHLENLAIAEKDQKPTEPATLRPAVVENSGSVPTHHVVRGFCSVCKVKVPMGGNCIAEHVKGANHLENVAISEKLKKTTNSVSATSESQKDLRVYNSIPNSNALFCTVCNVKVSNSDHNLDQHLKGALHKENLDNLKMFDLIPTNERLCKICKVRVPNKADNMHEHLNGQNHKRNAEKCLPETKNIATKAEPMKTEPVLLSKLTTSSSNSSHLRYVREGVYCDICNVNMTNLGAVVSHINSKAHLSFSRKWEQEHLASETARHVSPNNSTPVSSSADTSRTNSRDSSAMRQSANNNPKPKASTSVYTCKICNVEVPNTPNNINDHIAGNRHKTNVSNPNSTRTKDINTDTEPKGPNLSLNKQDDIIEEVSETITKNSQVPCDENMNNPSTSHAKNKDCNIITPKTDTATSDNNKAEIKNTATDSENEDGFYICKICKVLVENNPTAIHSHLNSYKHTSNTQEQKEKMKEALQEQKLYSCEICRCEMLDNPIKIKAHNDSLCHMKKFLNLLSLNKIRVRDNKVCYCELCDLYFNKFSVLSHIERELHKKKMA